MTLKRRSPAAKTFQGLGIITSRLRDLKTREELTVKQVRETTTPVPSTLQPLRYKMEYDEEDYFIPLQDQRVFGAGIKRKRVQFVPSTDPNLTTTTSKSQKTASSSSIGDTYLSIVLPRSTSEPAQQSKEKEPKIHHGKDESATIAKHSKTTTATDDNTTHETTAGSTTAEVETQTEPRSSSQPPPHSNCEICHLPLHTSDSTSPTTHHSSRKSVV